MKYIKTTIILHKNKRDLNKEDKSKIKQIRDYLFSFSFFDIDYLDSTFKVSDYRESNIVIDMSNSQKMRTVVSRYDNTFYMSINIRNFDVDFMNSKILINFCANKLEKVKFVKKVSKLPTLYHLSTNSKLPVLMNPNRDISLESVDIREHLPNRTSFSTSIEGCFRAIYPNILDMVVESEGKPLIFYVYVLSSLTKPSMYMTPEELTEKNIVHDACFTSEYCFFKSVFVSKAAKIEVNIAKDTRSQKLTYGFFGSIPAGEDTGWAPDMDYVVKAMYGNKFNSLSKYDLMLRNY